MRGDKTIIIANNILLSRGLMHYMLHAFPKIHVEIYSTLKSISTLENENLKVVFLEQKLDEPLQSLSLEKIHLQYQDIKIVAITDTALPNNIAPFFFNTISYSDSESMLLGKLKDIYSNNQTVPKSDDSLLSEREKEVLRGVALGLTNNEISENLIISAHTVITHRKNISAKLGIKTIAGLAIYAALNGIISDEEIGTNS